MPNAVYDVYTNLNPMHLTELATETFIVWLKFALGAEELGGHTLQHPTGRYASAISWRVTGAAQVSIIADESKIKEVGAIEYGRQPQDMKLHMLYGGKAHISKEGYYYRTLPLRPDQWRKTPILQGSMLEETGTNGRFRSDIGRLWAKKRPHIDDDSRFRTMSNKPGSARWLVPGFVAYAPGAILAELLRQEYGV